MIDQVAALSNLPIVDVSRMPSDATTRTLPSPLISFVNSIEYSSTLFISSLELLGRAGLVADDLIPEQNPIVSEALQRIPKKEAYDRVYVGILEPKRSHREYRSEERAEVTSV